MGLSLNIGCGDKVLGSISGNKCINVDIRQLDGVDIVCDARHLPFKNECFDRVLAYDIIEHFPVSETENLLKEWTRVLKINGRMKIRTPSMKWVAYYYIHKKDAKFVSYHIFGGQEYEKNFHYVLFDYEWLSALCKKYGLKTIDYKEIHSNFEMVLNKER